MTEWRQLHVASSQPEALEEWLWALGAVSVTLQDASDDPVLEPAPGEIRLWPDTIVSALFEADTDLAPVLQQLKDSGLCDGPEAETETLADRCWEREWLSDFGPMRFGRRLWVAPHGAVVDTDPEAVILRMDPGLAFGTGTHATTRLCLQWLDACELSGKTVIDFGCGSGVLAVAAALLGAAQVIACDIDPQAMLATRENARANGVLDQIQLLPAGQVPEEACDIVLANILAGTLIELRPLISRLVRPEGQLVLSGILAEQAQAVTDAYSEQFLLTSENSEAWMRLAGRRFAPAD